MKAAILTGSNVEIRDVPQPQPCPAEVLVRVRACGLNRADLQMVAGVIHGQRGGAGTLACCNAKCTDPSTDLNNCGGCNLACAPKNATGTCRICDMCCKRLAPIRFVPFSYFCTCWNVIPRPSPSFV